VPTPLPYLGHEQLGLTECLAETRKALRRLKSARKAVGDAPEGEQREEAERRQRAAEVDWRYATYFPLERRYVSLFRGEKDGEGERDSAGSGDPEVRARVETAMEEGWMAALELIRCELTVVETVEDKGKGDEGIADDGDESDGGFFE
jgi:rRNA-processing protein Efg1